MSIRIAHIADAPAISRLLTQLGYPGTEPFIEANLREILPDPREVALVWADNATVLGFLSLEFSIYPEIRGRLATIKCFVVDENARSRGIGQQLEAEITRLAREKGCDRIVVHCAARRTLAHEFYYRRGYEESPKYLVKSLL